MDVCGPTTDELGEAPLPAVLGHIYSSKAHGTLKVFDCSGTSVAFVFWFKRGFPCFSYSRDGVARLGEQLSVSKRELVESTLDRPEEPSDGGKQLSGQMLIAESLATLEEIEAALVGQLLSRLLCCSAAAEYTFQFDEGMDDFGVVPLSSPLLNPLEAAAKAATVVPFQRVKRFLRSQIGKPRIRLAEDRRIPPVARLHLSEAFVSALADPQSVSRILEVPSQLRALCFLYSFGFVELLEAGAAAEPKGTQRKATAAIRAEDNMLAWLVRLVRSGATYYELLQVAPTVSRSQIKQSYRNIAFTIHPDRVPAEQGAASQEVFAAIVDAYHTLSKERLRTAYDGKLVTSGSWQRLGSLHKALTWLQGRHDFLNRIGLAGLAMEYSRLIASLNMDPLVEAARFVGSRPRA